MKKRFEFALIVLLFLPVWVFAQSTEEKLQAVIDSFYVVSPASVGIMVHIESPEQQISWSGAVGYSDKNTKVPLEADQPALIASNIKTFVSATILRLVEDGKLSIHQPIKKFLTDKTKKLFEKGGYNLDSIRIEHLLSHTSGIQNYANQFYIDFINNNKNYRCTG